MSVDATAQTAPDPTPAGHSGCGCGGHSHDEAPQQAPAHTHGAGGGCGCGGNGNGGGCGAHAHGGADQSSPSAPATTVADGPVLTDAATEKAQQLLLQEGRDDLVLRIAVAPGGCAGLRYQLVFDDQVGDDDISRDFGGVSLVVDKMSAPYLASATIDYSDTLEKSGFTIDNPAAQGSCACGDSFN